MAARRASMPLCIALACFFPFLAPVVQTEAQEPGDPAGRVAQQWHSRQGEERDSVEDRWREGSERLGRLRFDKEGNWRTREQGFTYGKEQSDSPTGDMQRLRKEGQERERARQLAWQSRAREIKKKWGSVKESSPTVYVAYTKDNDAYGGVDYETGVIEVGAIAPIFFQDAPVRVERLLSERLSFLLRGQSMPGEHDLEGQVRMPGSGRVISQSEVQQLSHYVAKSGEPPRSYTAPDGVRRLRKQIKIELVPDHLKTRVRQYLPYVEKAARIYEVAPELILAVIQTESVFNPRAVSHAGAVGLMQLVPSSGALEASKLVYGEPRLLTREELTQPDKNIELGAAYLRILLKRYFGRYTEEPRKRLFLVIAGYNCGPRRVKNALGGQDTTSLSCAEFYDLLLRVVPRETQVYLQRVVRNMRQYESIMGMGPKSGFRFTQFSMLFRRASKCPNALIPCFPSSDGSAPLRADFGVLHPDTCSFFHSS